MQFLYFSSKHASVNLSKYQTMKYSEILFFSKVLNLHAFFSIIISTMDMALYTYTYTIHNSMHNNFVFYYLCLLTFIVYLLFVVFTSVGVR